MKKYDHFLVIGLLCFAVWVQTACQSPASTAFSGNQAMQYAQKLMSFGDRIPGSQASAETANYIQSELSKNGWSVNVQEFTHLGVGLRNIVARKSNLPPDVVIAAHYDTREFADEASDPALQALPVPGANDGTSGTAVLLELARALRSDDTNTWLVFFDGEDQGRLHGWDWSVGAQYFADHLNEKPAAVVVIDMIGDSDLNVYRETQSDSQLTNAIWTTAQSLGFGNQIINSEKYTMLDDHLPFIKLGIPSCLMIDFDYPYWHKRSDTLDKISSDSLYAIGQTLLAWLRNRH